MTIFDYNSLPTITVPYILRDETNPPVGVWVTNQETKDSVFCDSVTIGELSAFFYDGYFTINVTDILTTINKNSTIQVKVIDSLNLPIYRDMVCFETRLDVENDYEQNNVSNQYAFV